MEIGRFGKTFLSEMAVQYAADFVRGLMVELLKDMTAKDCYRAIRDNVNLWSASPKSLQGEGHTLAGRFEQYSGFLTTELVIEWLKADRPDLASVIVNTPGGIEWLDGQVENVKGQLWK